MDNVIPFPVRGKDGRSKMLEWAAATYRKAGLSEAAITSATAEFADSLDRYIAEPMQIPFKVPDCGLTPTQWAALDTALDNFSAELRSQTSHVLSMALVEIAGYIGAVHKQAEQ